MMHPLQILRRRSFQLVLILGGGLLVWFISAHNYRDGPVDPGFWLAVLGLVMLATGVFGFLFLRGSTGGGAPPAA